MSWIAFFSKEAGFSVSGNLLNNGCSSRQEYRIIKRYYMLIDELFHSHSFSPNRRTVRHERGLRLGVQSACRRGCRLRGQTQNENKFYSAFSVTIAFIYVCNCKHDISISAAIEEINKKALISRARFPVTCTIIPLKLPDLDSAGKLGIIYKSNLHYSVQTARAKRRRKLLELL